MVGSLRRLYPASTAALLALTSFSPATALAAQTQAQSAHDISVELNKLEPLGKGCRAYVVVDNATDAAYSVLKLDIVLFRPDGVIDRRIAIDLGPLPANKKDVKTFDLEATPCSQIGSMFVNDVLECKSGEQDVSDCLDRFAVSSRGPATLSK
ncbi:hypothetical protein [Pseudaminobacter soli (ex Li et al. 2025)]|uniref:Tat pathway signal sequence domain protein n=1 Tax=Pseudaminobacter soli (ex Li et al. 2025) TaxID=1295366 RepID=A0A2P7SD14_9HYPH|nr:hypothetical protein [Mesorhizobium soli]PSJ60378.1 hypothetical protein C7I85_14630 [Mesorhizobium soli]